MAHLIDKSALVADIERLKDKFSGYPTCTNYDYGVKDGRLVGYDEVLHIIDTLEVKEVDLEKAIDDYIYTHDGRKRLTLELDWKYCNLTLKGGDEIIKFAKHFFELGLRLQTETNITFKYNIGESVREYKAQKGE